MMICEIIDSLIEQAEDKDRLAGGDPASDYTREADVLMEAARLLKKQETPNAPLTLEELREMDGEPVWVVPFKGEIPIEEAPKPEYALVSVANEWLCTSNTDYWEFEVYGRGILAYRRKPEEDGVT